MSEYFTDDVQPGLSSVLSNTTEVEGKVDKISAGGECFHVIRVFSRTGRPFGFRTDSVIPSAAALEYPDRSSRRAWTERGEVEVDQSTPDSGVVLATRLLHTKVGVETLDRVKVVMHAAEPRKVAKRVAIEREMSVRSSTA